MSLHNENGGVFLGQCCRNPRKNMLSSSEEILYSEVMLIKLVRNTVFFAQ